MMKQTKEKEKRRRSKKKKKKKRSSFVKLAKLGQVGSGDKLVQLGSS